MKKIKLQYGPKPVFNEIDLFLVENAKGTIINFHGGGFVAGDKSDPQFEDITRDFIEHDFNFANVNYSLYPDTKFPLYLYESAKAVKTICDYSKINNPYLAGTSAGAYICMMLCLNNEYLDSVNINPLDIKGWIFESGQATSHFNIMNIEKGLDPYLQRIDELAPLYYVNDKTKLSRALFILYDNDMPNRYEQNKLLISAIKHYYPEADITDILLPGTHCVGSSVKDKDGRYPFVKEILKWAK